MKITIRTNPGIVIEVDSAKQEEKVQLARVIHDTVINEEEEPDPQPAAKRGRPKGNRCSNCGEAGHTAKPLALAA